jgi:hypothetical protein
LTAGTIAYLAGFALLVVLALVGAALTVRAVVHSRDEGPPSWWAVLLAAGVLVAVPVGAIAAYLLLPAPVSERGLRHSMERRTDEPGSFECSDARDERWACRFRDPSGGTARYEVRAGWSCWRARRMADNAEARMPNALRGCTTVRDSVGVGYLLVGSG